MKPSTIITAIIVVLATLAAANATIYIQSYGPQGNFFGSNTVTSISYSGQGYGGGVYHNGPSGYDFGGYTGRNSGFGYSMNNGYVTSLNARSNGGLSGGIYASQSTGSGYSYQGSVGYGNQNVGYRTYYPVIRNGFAPTPYYGYQGGNYGGYSTGFDRTGSSYY